MLVAADNVRIPPDELSITFVRSAGPGGQNVNKVASKAQLRWNVAASPSLTDDVRRRFLQRYSRRITRDGDVVISSQRYRDAPRNADDCREKLRAMLSQVAHPPKRRRPTRRTRASVERRLRQKRARGQKKQARRAEPE
jgi:ribosome-associated protein